MIILFDDPPHLLKYLRSGPIHLYLVHLTYHLTCLPAEQIQIEYINDHHVYLDPIIGL